MPACDRRLLLHRMPRWGYRGLVGDSKGGKSHHASGNVRLGGLVTGFNLIRVTELEQPPRVTRRRQQAALEAHKQLIYNRGFLPRRAATAADCWPLRHCLKVPMSIPTVDR